MTAIGRRIAVAALALPFAACTKQGGETAADSAAPPADSAATATPSVSPAPPAPATDSAKPAPNASAPSAAPRDSVKPSAPTPTPTPTATPSETVLTGRVMTGGLAAEPVTQLRVEGAKPTTLTGPLEPELRRLSAATVLVAGAPGAATPNATFAVSRYEVISINGSKPLVGSIVSRGADALLASGADTLRLVSPPAELRTKVGAKVWIIGRRSSNDLAVQTFGVIREP